MAFKAPFIPPKKSLEDAEGIDSFALSETEKIEVIGQVVFASTVLAKHNGEEVVLKERPCKHVDEKGNQKFEQC